MRNTGLGEAQAGIKIARRNINNLRYADGEENGNPLQCSCLEKPRDRGAWWAAVYGVAQSRTRLKRLSSSSIILGEFSIHLLLSVYYIHGIVHME